MDAEAIAAAAKAIEGKESLWLYALLLLAGLVFWAQRLGLLSFLTPRTNVQVEDFQGKMLSALTASHAREDALMAKLDAADDRNDELREQVQESRFEVRMMRAQLRLFLKGFQQVKAGVIPIEALELPELPEALT